jgi:hypothetical protein
MGLDGKRWFRSGRLATLGLSLTTGTLALARGFSFKFIEERGHEFWVGVEGKL